MTLQFPAMDKVIGPSMALQKSLGEDFGIVATFICGDSCFGENPEKAADTICEMVKQYNPDVFVIPAFMFIVLPNVFGFLNELQFHNSFAMQS